MERVVKAWHALLGENNLDLTDADLGIDETSLLDYLHGCLEADDEDLTEESMNSLTEILCEFVPRLGTLDRSIIFTWLNKLSFALNAGVAEEEERGEVKKSPTSRHHNVGASSSSNSSAFSDPQSRTWNSKLQQLSEIFPNERREIIKQYLVSTDGDVETAIGSILDRLSDVHVAIDDSDSRNHDITETTEMEKAQVRASIIDQYNYVDVQADKRTYCPPPPKYSSEKQRMRFLNGQSVDTHGQKYFELKKAKSETAPQPVFLKALKKYKKH